MFTKQSLAEKQNKAWRAYYFFIRTVLAFALPYTFLVGIAAALFGCYYALLLSVFCLSVH